MIFYDFEEMKYMKSVNLAVVGATGVVGRKILDILEERNFKINGLYLFSSAKSAGKKVKFRDKEYTVSELCEDSFDNNIDIALFSAGGSTSLKYAEIAAKKGVRVVDNSSAWRMAPNVPLVIPEINPNAIKEDNMIIANPNCSTIQSVIAIKPIYDKYGIKRIIYNTYQAVSGAGIKGIEDLKNNTTNKFKYSISLNCIPQIDVFLDNGYTKEEMKMVNETRKILENDNIKITATAVRVPIENSHAVSINLETEKNFNDNELFDVIKNGKDIILMDDTENEVYPLETAANGKDEVFVGRVRRDFSIENGINMWCVADNIRKGAATNAVQIAELLVERYF